MRSAILALISLCLLTACDSTQSLKELRNAPVADDPYQQALAEGYKNFAEAKVANYDWWTSKYFADKGLMAAYGRDTQPEEAKNWDIPATMRPEFDDARGKLIAAVAANKTTQPAQNNKWDVAKIEETKDAFFVALTKLTEAHTDEAAASPTPAAPVESTSTILYFPLDSDKLGDSATAALAELVRYIKSAGNVAVTINGHADRVGTEAYNMDLSERRARFVMKALEAAGVPDSIMKYFAFGESDPAVPTADGVEEPKNRRVEIFIE